MPATLRIRRGGSGAAHYALKAPPARSGAGALRHALLLLVATACSSMLPTASDRAPLPWDSYDDAQQAIGRIEPFATTREQLHAQHFDPARNPAVTILNYTDLLQRLPAVPAVPLDRLERGISACLQAGKRCNAYSIQVRQMQTRRTGNFWLDLFNFQRVSVTTGWSFNALVIFVDDTVVYALGGGQPKFEDAQTTRNPLGPFQGIGSSLPIP